MTKRNLSSLFGCILLMIALICISTLLFGENNNPNIILPIFTISMIIGCILVVISVNEVSPDKSYTTPILLTKEEMEEILTQDEFLNAEPFVVGFFEKSKTAIGYTRCYKFFHNYDSANAWYDEYELNNPHLPIKMWCNHVLIIPMDNEEEEQLY